jgi:hypothetical protein
MNITADRLIGDQATIAKLTDLISCFNCQKCSLSNTYYDQPCHKGVYCQECISFCSKCCQVKGQPIQGRDQLLQSLSIKCVNSPNGCNLALAIGDIANHEKLCTFCQSDRPIDKAKAGSNPLNEAFKFGKSMPQTNLAFPSNYESPLQASILVNQKFLSLKKGWKH